MGEAAVCKFSSAGEKQLHSSTYTKHPTEAAVAAFPSAGPAPQGALGSSSSPLGPLSEATLDADQHALFDLIHIYGVSMCLHAAVKLGIPDVLAAAAAAGGRGTAMSATEIVPELPDKSVKPDTVGRLLRALSAFGVFEEIGDDDPAASRFALNSKSALLASATGRADHPSMADYVKWELCPFTWQAWQCLAQAIETNGQAFAMANGKAVWDISKEHPESGAEFDRAMTCSSQETIPAILKAYPEFGEMEGTLVDVAGGFGIVAAAIKAAHPHLRVVNFDLPEVTQRAPPLEGVEFVGGDMFEPGDIPKADIIFMKRVIHDWGDETNMKILKNCHSALADNGKLVIVDAVVPPANDSSERAHRVKLLDVLMFTVCDNGRERTGAEWKSLLEASGFALTRIIQTSASVVDIIEGVKI